MSDMKQFPWILTPWNFAPMQYGCSTSSLLYLLCGAANFGGQHEVRHIKNEEVYAQLFVSFFHLCIFLYSKNTLVTLGKIYKK